MHWSNETRALVMAKKVDALEARIDQGFVSVQERHEEALESLSAEVGEARSLLEEARVSTEAGPHAPPATDPNADAVTSERLPA